ncbi:Rab3 GTPase-activating protein [Aureococcus anophagefferens]|nr:Rab3 GTPase-activating protein [Aureococcus anophagefferens]
MADDWPLAIAHGRVAYCAFRATSVTVAAVDGDEVRVVALGAVPEVPCASVEACDVAWVGRRLVVCASDGTVRCFDGDACNPTACVRVAASAGRLSARAGSSEAVFRARPGLATFLAFDGGGAPRVSHHKVAAPEPAALAASRGGKALGVGSADGEGARREGERHGRAARSRVFFDDAGREAHGVAVSPRGDLAAVSDNLGRVLLVDVAAGRLVRLFKGARRAQVAWVEVDDGDGAKTPGLYLAILAPQRALARVWRCRFGPCVAAFRVPPELTRLVEARARTAAPSPTSPAGRRTSSSSRSPWTARCAGGGAARGATSRRRAPRRARSARSRPRTNAATRRTPRRSSAASTATTALWRASWTTLRSCGSPAVVASLLAHLARRGDALGAKAAALAATERVRASLAGFDEGGADGVRSSAAVAAAAPWLDAAGDQGGWGGAGDGLSARVAAAARRAGLEALPPSPALAAERAAGPRSAAAFRRGAAAFAALHADGDAAGRAAAWEAALCAECFPAAGAAARDAAASIADFGRALLAPLRSGDVLGARASRDAAAALGLDAPMLVDLTCVVFSNLPAERLRASASSGALARWLQALLPRTATAAPRSRPSSRPAPRARGPRPPRCSPRAVGAAAPRGASSSSGPTARSRATPRDPRGRGAGDGRGGAAALAGDGGAWPDRGLSRALRDADAAMAAAPPDGAKVAQLLALARGLGDAGDLGVPVAAVAHLFGVAASGLGALLDLRAPPPDDAAVFGELAARRLAEARRDPAVAGALRPAPSDASRELQHELEGLGAAPRAVELRPKDDGEPRSFDFKPKDDGEPQVMFDFKPKDDAEDDDDLAAVSRGDAAAIAARRRPPPSPPRGGAASSALLRAPRGAVGATVDGATALHAAAGARCAECVAALLGAGATFSDRRNDAAPLLRGPAGRRRRGRRAAPEPPSAARRAPLAAPRAREGRGWTALRVAVGAARV